MGYIIPVFPMVFDRLSALEEMILKVQPQLGGVNPLMARCRVQFDA
jgi:hypothetical protein